MAYDFPASPTIGQTYQGYTWDGEKWVGGPGAALVLRSYLAGLTLSTAGSSATFGIAAGTAADSTNAAMMTLAAAITKTTAAWAVGSGNGALDTGAIAAAAWYHVFLIRNPTTGVVDAVVSATATPDAGPTVLPPGFTQFRRIGSMKTAASQWVKFSQLGNDFLWGTPVTDVNLSTSLGTTAVTPVMSVPPGVQVWAKIRGFCSNASTATILVSSLDETPSASSSPTGNLTWLVVAGVTNALPTMDVRTNTSAQVRAVSNIASSTLVMTTFGWIDPRGRD
jgi:hypothetical protein